MLSEQLISVDEARRVSGLARLIDYTRADMARVNELIVSRAASHVEMVPEIASYLIEAGGKRLRPMLTLASARLFGGGADHQIAYAAAVEFMHTATLLHDDVVDDSDRRRGKPAARLVWGNPASVLVGDYLLGQAFVMMVEARDLDALAVMSRASATIAEGEVFQLTKTRDLKASAEDYFAVIRAKTATLFEAATEVGAMAGGADAASRTAMKKYGHELGIAFQLVDDVLDLGKGTGALGKNTGDDLREGKMTLPVILGLERARENERIELIGALGDGGLGEAGIRTIASLLDRLGALGDTLAEAESYAARARAALDALPPTVGREILADIADFCVARAY
jgi:octaprenyl-diphosphate synthase